MAPPIHLLFGSRPVSRNEGNEGSIASAGDAGASGKAQLFQVVMVSSSRRT